MFFFFSLFEHEIYDEKAAIFSVNVSNPDLSYILVIKSRWSFVAEAKASICTK